MDDTRDKQHDHLRHDGVFDEEEYVEKHGVGRGEAVAVDVVEGHGREGQAEGPCGPGKAPPTGLPGLGEAQAYQGPAVAHEGGERAGVQAHPFGVGAPLFRQCH